MQQTMQQWDAQQIKQYENETGQALLSDEQTLVSFSNDFGQLVHSRPSAVATPQNTKELVQLIQFANLHRLPLTIRGNGLSQSGQSLPGPGGVTVSMQAFNKTSALEDNSIWVEANTSWADLLAVSLTKGKAPHVLPYNCNLSVAGVISAGGVGASSFKFGSINAHVKALEVIDGQGQLQVVDQSSDLFHACLSGQGRCAVISKAQIQLRSVKPQVKTFFLIYADQEQWFADCQKAQEQADYMELFCSPSMQGGQLIAGKRVPLVKWLYGLHLSMEYDEVAPKLNDFIAQLQPWQVLHSQEESIASYLLRHDSRFEIMKKLGQWELFHPWYECFVPTQVLKNNLEYLLNALPTFYASLLHVVPMAKRGARFLMLPDSESICSVMILNPGITLPLKDSCLQAIHTLDACFLPHGGKRYLSGYLGQSLSQDYWAKHFGDQYSAWVDAKKKWDPTGIFTSQLF